MYSVVIIEGLSARKVYRFHHNCSESAEICHANSFVRLWQFSSIQLFLGRHKSPDFMSQFVVTFQVEVLLRLLSRLNFQQCLIFSNYQMRCCTCQVFFFIYMPVLIFTPRLDRKNTLIFCCQRDVMAISLGTAPVMVVAVVALNYNLPVYCILYTVSMQGAEFMPNVTAERVAYNLYCRYNALSFTSVISYVGLLKITIYWANQNVLSIVFPFMYASGYYCK